MDTKNKGSLGVLAGLNLDSKEDKNLNSKEAEMLDTKEVKKKRSYALPSATIKKLSELKLYDYPEETNLEDIVNEAILHWYHIKHEKDNK